MFALNNQNVWKYIVMYAMCDNTGYFCYQVRTTSYNLIQNQILGIRKFTVQKKKGILFSLTLNGHLPFKGLIMTL